MHTYTRYILLLAVVLFSAFRATAQLAMPDNVCVGAEKHYWVDSTSAAGHTIIWKIDGAIQQSGTVNLFAHTWGTAGTYTIAVQEISADGCPGPQRSGEVFVAPLPTAALSGSTTICEGGTASLHVEFTGTPPWDLTYSNGFTNTTISNITPNPYIFGVAPPGGINTYSLTALSDANCSATQAQLSGTAIIMANPMPVTDFTSTTACLGDTTFFSTMTNPLGYVTHWAWDFGDGTFGTYNAPSTTPHVYEAYGSFNVTLTVSDSIGCTYTVSHMVDVRPLPQAFFSNSTLVCDGTAVAFADLSSNPSGQGYIQQWAWDFGDGSVPQLLVFPASPNVSHTYPAPGTYNATLTITSSLGCEARFTNSVTIVNRPVAAFTFSNNCVGETTQFTDASLLNGLVPLNSRHWDFGDLLSGIQNTSDLKDPQHIYAASGTYTVMLIAANTGGCSDTAYRQVTVKPPPLANFTSSPGCVGASTFFWADTTLINVNTIATYNWDFGDGETSNSRNTLHTYPASGVYNVTLTIQDTSGCSGSFSHAVPITVPPQAHFTVNVNNCKSQSVQFTDFSTALAGYNTSWSWDFGDGTTQQVSFPANPDVSHIYQQAGTFAATLSITNSEGCTSTESKTIMVSESPTANFMYAGHCEGSAVAFTDLTSAVATAAINSWAWNFGDPASGITNTANTQNSGHIFAAGGTYNVQLIAGSNSGCTDTVSKTILINVKPAVGFTTQGRCEGSPIAFVPASTVTQNAIASWLWQFGDGSNSTVASPLHTYSLPGTYTTLLIVTDTGGCSNTISKVITIVPEPSANFAFTTPGCSQSSISFNDLTSVPAGFITKWIWDFGDGTVQTVNFPNPGAIIHTYANAGSFNVTLMVKTGDSCSSIVSKLVTVSPKPAAAFTHSGNCQDANVLFNDISNSPGAGITGRLWDFGDAGSGAANQSTLINPSHIYTLAGTYTVDLIVSTGSGCSDTVSETITISPPPLINFSSVAGCKGDTTQFNSSASLNMATTASWLWQFGDGQTSALPDPAHIYAQNGTYVVSLTIVDTSGCPATKVAQVTITAGPVAAFSVSSLSCTGTTITYTDLSNYTTGSISSWHWTFGDGSDTTYSVAATAISHVYSQAGSFMVTLTVDSPDGCQNTFQQIITISSVPQAGFAWLNTCEGTPTQFNDQSVALSGVTIVGRIWNFGDPTTGINNTSILANPIHAFTAAGTYQVSLAVTNATGCTDTVQKQVTITSKPGVDFSFDTIRCMGTPMAFYTDTLSTTISAVQSYNWDFGDGSPASNLQDPVHSYALSGTYSVTLTIMNLNGCENSIIRQINVGEPPVSSFSYANACQFSPTQFTDQSYAPDNGNIAGWYWEFGVNGTTTDTSTLQNPNYTYILPGTYTVKLTTISASGCAHTKSMPVQIFNKPTAAFANTASPCSNGSVQFRDSSYSYQSGIATWHWEFEPFQYSTAQNPAYQYYATDSCYSVQLIISDLRGCSDSASHLVCVPALLAISFTDQKDCFGIPTRFEPQLQTPAGDSLIGFQWNFGDPQSGAGNLSTLKTPAHLFTKPGFYTVHLTATDKYGCSASRFQTLSVRALPTASFTYSAGQCDSTVVFTSTSTDTSAQLSAYIWNYGDGSADTLTAPNNTATHKYLSAGTFAIKLTIINEYGCTDEQTLTYQPGPCLEADFTFVNQTTGCQNNLISFSDKSVCQGSISAWDWDWGDGTPPTTYTLFSQFVTHTFTLSGVYKVKLRVTTLVNGIPFTDSTSNSINILASPVAGFTSAGACIGSRCNFLNTTNANGTAIESYNWDFGNPGSYNDTSARPNPSYVYSSAGIFEPRLIVTNQLGCSDTATNTVSVFGLPTADFNFSVACLGHPTHLFDQSAPDIAPLTHLGWLISKGDQTIGQMTGPTPSFTFDSLGVYSILHAVSDSNYCSDTILRQLTVVPAPFSVFNMNENYENKQGRVQFENGSLGADEYYWDFGNGETSGATSPVINYTEDGNYLVQLYAKNNFDCTDSTSAIYKMLFKGLWIPNALAVGPISSVRLWKPVGENLSVYTAAIFDRWGNRIWHSDKLTEKGAPAEGWDGTINGVPCHEGVYVWKITAIFSDGTIWYNNAIGNHEGLSDGNTGTITLIR